MNAKLHLIAYAGIAIKLSGIFLISLDYTISRFP